MTRRAAGLLALLVLAPAAYAQPTNADLFRDMALECAGPVASELPALQLVVPAAQPYLGDALLARWQHEGRTVYVNSADSTSATRQPRLELRVEGARVSYARAPRGRLARRLALDLHYRLVAADGQVLRADGCAAERSDVIARSAVPLVETESYPETRGTVPSGSWISRYVEPAVLTAATAVTVFLLFTLRSGSAGSDS